MTFAFVGSTTMSVGLPVPLDEIFDVVHVWPSVDLVRPAVVRMVVTPWDTETPRTLPLTGSSSHVAPRSDDLETPARPGPSTYTTRASIGSTATKNCPRNGDGDSGVHELAAKSVA